MLKKSITYTDYDGNERTEDFWFHLNENEVLQWLVTNQDCTLDKVLLKMIRSGRGRDVMDSIEDLIRRSYGEKSPDGRSFIKSPEVFERFRYTEAYSKLFMELATNATAAAAFVNAIIPKSMADKIATVMNEDGGSIPPEIKDYISVAGGKVSEIPTMPAG